jgi:hypothetical protein
MNGLIVPLLGMLAAQVRHIYTHCLLVLHTAPLPVLRDETNSCPCQPHQPLVLNKMRFSHDCDHMAYV